MEKIKQAFSSKLFLGICVLMTIMTFLCFGIVKLLLTIALWICFGASKVAAEKIPSKGFSMLAGVTGFIKVFTLVLSCVIMLVGIVGMTISLAVKSIVPDIIDAYIDEFGYDKAQNTYYYVSDNQSDSASDEDAQDIINAMKLDLNSYLKNHPEILNDLPKYLDENPEVVKEMLAIIEENPGFIKKIPDLIEEYSITDEEIEEALAILLDGSNEVFDKAIDIISISLLLIFAFVTVMGIAWFVISLTVFRSISNFTHSVAKSVKDGGEIKNQKGLKVGLILMVIISFLFVNLYTAVVYILGASWISKYFVEKKEDYELVYEED